MSLAKKMFIENSTLVPCVGLPTEVDLGDIHPWSASLAAARAMVSEGKSPSFFVFVENQAQLEDLTPDLFECWGAKQTFWLFYPKKPHLNTDLGRDKTFEIMKKAGMSGTRQVGVDSLWSCLYFKAK